MIGCEVNSDALADGGDTNLRQVLVFNVQSEQTEDETEDAGDNYWNTLRHPFRRAERKSRNATSFDRCDPASGLVMRVRIYAMIFRDFCIRC